MRKILLTYVKPHVQEDPVAMPLGITYLGGMLQRENIPVELCDERIVNDSEMRAAIDRVDVCGFSAMTPNIRRAIAWAKYAKEQGKITVMGGPHASVDPTMFLDSGHFDYVISGEADYSLPQFMKALESGNDADLLEVPGINGVRDGEVWVRNPSPPLIKNLDALPLPARDLLPMERYFELNPEHLAYIFTTRGCPFKCIFCQKDYTGRGFRVRSTESIVDELEMLVKTHDPGVILFVDEIMTLRRGRIHEMCDEILRRNLKFEWIANTRGDCVDYPLLKHMFRAGCRRIYYGWETGSQPMLDTLKKDITVEQIIESARLTRRAGMWAKVYLIVGTPGEKMEHIRETERVLRIASPDLIRISVFNPLLGTESWDNYQANIDTDNMAENYVSSNRSAYKHENFSQIELEEIRKEMVRTYERWYYSMPARSKRIWERCLFYAENPTFLKKRVGRLFGMTQRDRSVLKGKEISASALVLKEHGQEEVSSK